MISFKGQIYFSDMDCEVVVKYRFLLKRYILKKVKNKFDEYYKFKYLAFGD